MNSEKKESNILKFKKRRQLNIGIITFGILFIYLIATIIMYITAPHVTTYEVRQGSILKDYAYTALALREETIVYANDNGYINYYTEDNSKVKVGSAVYTISTQELDFQSAENIEQNLTDHELKSLSSKIQNFNDTFHEDEFSYVYKFKDDFQSSIAEYTSQSKLEQLNQLLSSGKYSNIFMKYSGKDGILVLSMDGFESITSETFTLEQLSKTNYKKTDFTNNTPIISGDPVFKLITNETWNLMFEISDEVAKVLAEDTVVTVNFKKDNQKVKANFEIINKEGKNVMILTMYNSMIRYCNDRYLDIELVLEDQTGLKIPKSAETTKDFYVVSASYLTQGGDSNSDGVLIQKTDYDGNAIIQFLPVTVYYEEDEMVYLDPNVFVGIDTLLKPNSADTCKLSEMKSLIGVYSVNKGYAVFKQIAILCESDDYYIVEEGNDFGLSNYDHIALNSEEVTENDVVF